MAVVLALVVLEVILVMVVLAVMAAVPVDQDQQEHLGLVVALVAAAVVGVAKMVVLQVALEY
jgi:hypothetical protein